MAIEGAFLSILLPPIGPATAALSARSTMRCEPVAASLVSLPAATVVTSENAASAALASPDVPSDAVQATVTFPACHWSSAAPHAIDGAARSSLILAPATLDTLPASSRADPVTAVTPSDATTNEATAPGTVV